MSEWKIVRESDEYYDEWDDLFNELDEEWLENPQIYKKNNFKKQRKHSNKLLNEIGWSKLGEFNV